MFNSDSIEKQLNITFGGVSYTNAELGSEEMELTEQLCSDPQLRFGSCEASIFSIRILDTVEPLKGKQIAVSMEMCGEDTEQFAIGKYKVDSDKPTANRHYREIVAYDAMYDIINADVAEWYNVILPADNSEVTLREFRTSFLSYLGIEQEEITLVNDDMLITRTVAPVQLSGKTVITAICEINGCFGHIGRNGKFQYIHLKEMKEGLYPSDTIYPAEDLYPADAVNAEQISKNHYISAKYEDYTTAKITGLQIRQEENDVGCTYGEEDNLYIVQDNFLLYGKSAEELEQIAANIYSVISHVWYHPAHVEAKGNPCLEVGDGIRLSTRYEIVYTYILQRTLKGIQALRDTYDAKGEQYQSVDVNSTQEQIIQLKGKTNTLTRTLEETRLEIKDIEGGLSSRITANASSIEAEVKRAIGQEVELAAAIKINVDNISLKVSKDSIISEINQTAETVTIAASKIDLKGLVEADEFITKFATIASLNVTNGIVANKADLTTVNALNGEINTLKVGKLDASEFTAGKISALGISVKAANVTGKLTADQVDVAGIVNSNTFRGAAITVQALYALAGITVGGTACSWKTAQVINSSGNVVELKYLGA